MTRQVFDDIDRYDSRVFTATFVIPGGDPDTPADRRDPTDVYFTLRSPSGTEQNFHYGALGSEALTKASTGMYQYTIDFPESLSWWGRFRGTGTVVAVVIFEPIVRTDVFAT